MESQHFSDIYRRLVDSVSDYAIFALDDKGYVATWSPGAQNIKGYTENEIIGRHFSSFYSPDDIASGKPARELEVAAREGRIEDEGWRLRKDGSRFWANVVISAVRNDQGELTGFAKVTRDLSDRRRAEEERRQSEERFRLLVQSVEDYAILMLDPDGRIASWNEGAERIKGYAADEIIGRSFTVFYPPEAVAEGFPQHELEVAAREGRFEDENWRVRKDGSRFWANVVVTALRNGDGRLIGFAKVTRDLTARREKEAQARRLAAEEAAHAEAARRRDELANLNEGLQAQAVELEAQAEELRVAAETLHERNEELQAVLAEEQQARTTAQRATRARDDLMAIIAHDLRTPMNIILTAVQMVANTLDEQVEQSNFNLSVTAELRDYNAIIQSTIKRMNSLVSDLLDVARIDSGNFAIRQTRVDLYVLIDDLLKLFQPQASERGITISGDIPAGIPAISADPDRLNQVFSNLLGNAFKFTSAGGRVLLRSRKVDGSVHIAVEDSGAGIAAADLPHIFDRYWQADRASRTGAGLGLAICKGIVEAHGGRIWVESEQGRGTTVHFTIPCAAE